MIRKATEQDIAAIQALISNNPETLLPRTDDEVRDLIPHFFIAVAENGEVVGCCCLEVYSKKIAEIRTVAVLTEHRHHGHGRQLVQAAVDKAREMDIHEIMVVTSSPSFFEQLGFSLCLNEKYALFWTGETPKKGEN